MPDLARAEGLLRELATALGVKLPAGELRMITPAQAALLDWFAAHPFARIRDLEVANGDPIIGDHELSAATAEKFRLVASRT